MKDRATNRVRAKVVERTDAATLTLRFVETHRTDWREGVHRRQPQVYHGAGEPRDGEAQSVSEYVNASQAHTNGVESFWSMLKRGYHGVYHHMSPKHLHRYVNEYAGRHNIRDMDTLDQMRDVVAGLVGRRLMWKDLTAE